MKENADFHYQSGLHPKIIRRANSGACKWCLALAGTYNYEDVKNTGNDVFRKHNNCKCSVVYDPADGSKKVQDVYSKTWQDETAVEERKRISLENAKRNGNI
ncbi:MAG: hypothetical protein LUF92_17185, partial [Clostridiales bacterium]|nr:hypothetical protein [Clostridiales bacterium]